MNEIMKQYLLENLRESWYSSIVNNNKKLLKLYIKQVLSEKGYNSIQFSDRGEYLEIRFKKKNVSIAKDILRDAILLITTETDMFRVKDLEVFPFEIYVHKKQLTEDKRLLLKMYGCEVNKYTTIYEKHDLLMKYLCKDLDITMKISKCQPSIKPKDFFEYYIVFRKTKDVYYKDLVVNILKERLSAAGCKCTVENLICFNYPKDIYFNQSKGEAFINKII